MNRSLVEKVISGHKRRFGGAPQSVAYAPGRIEVLGNHTDYNEGYVLSAAIDAGICAAVSGGKKKQCVLSALDVGEEAAFDLPTEKPVKNPHWANYLIGVVNGLGAEGKVDKGFNLTFAGDVPAGAGLSSSAALEVATALVLSAFYGLQLPKMQLAKICQRAENEFTGARCGLLDQISSLFGAEHALIFTDFRSLSVATEKIGADACFLLANTGVKHSLVESAYNERRASCERAAQYFTSVLDHPVKHPAARVAAEPTNKAGSRGVSLRNPAKPGTPFLPVVSHMAFWRRRVKALRDVSQDELKKHGKSLDPVIFKRAAHVIGENERVLKARELLQTGRMKEFGRLMFESHQSSRVNFENSCPELDFIVETACNIKKILGARLSGGGFGGSAVLLINPKDAAVVGQEIASAYAKRFGAACQVRVIKPSAGAHVLTSRDFLSVIPAVCPP